MDARFRLIGQADFVTGPRILTPQRLPFRHPGTEPTKCHLTSDDMVGSEVNNNLL